jgi:hypothetical protein
MKHPPAAPSKLIKVKLCGLAHTIDPDSLKIKSAVAPAVKREAEEDWRREHVQDAYRIDRWGRWRQRLSPESTI